MDLVSGFRRSRLSSRWAPMTAGSFSIMGLIRTAIAALLMLAAVTPALAEVGCFEDSFIHMQTAADSHDEGAVAEDATPDEGDRGPTSPPKHCAFNHGAHGFAVPTGAATDLDPHAVRAGYSSLIVRPLVAVAPDTPYHPPQA